MVPRWTLTGSGTHDGFFLYLRLLLKTTSTVAVHAVNEEAEMRHPIFWLILSLGLVIPSARAIDSNPQPGILAGQLINVTGSGLAAAVTAAGSSTRTIFVPVGSTVTANLTVPANVTLWVADQGLITVNPDVTLRINGSVTASPAQQIFFLRGTGAVRFGPGSVPLIYPTWFGAQTNGTNATATTDAIKAALASQPSYTSPFAEMGTVGGVRVHLISGVYAINETINVTPKNQIGVQYWFEGEGARNTYIVWAGGHNAAMLLVAHTNNAPNMQNAYLGHFTLFNKATSGSGLTAVRAIGIDGIQLNNSTVTGAGINRIMIEDIEFTYLRNGIVVWDAVNELTVRHCSFNTLYNQTNPVVNPKADALVNGAGDSIVIQSREAVGGSVSMVYVYDNTFNQQGYAIEALSAVGGFVGIGVLDFHDNFVNADPFIRAGGVRLQAFNTANIGPNNFFQDTGSGGMTCCQWVYLGTTYIGSGRVSGATIVGNYFSGHKAAGAQRPITISLADGTYIAGNSFYAIDYGIQVLAKATNVFVGPNNWVAGQYNGTIDWQGTQGTTTIVSLDPVVGYMGTAFDPETYAEFYEEFEAEFTLVAGGTTDATKYRWRAAAGGVYTAMGGGNPQGAIRIAGDGARPGAISSTQSTFVSSRNPTLKVRWAQRGAGAGNRYIGLSDSVLTANPSNGIYFRHTAGGSITAVCRSGGAESTLDTGVSAADAKYHLGRLVMTGGNTITVFLDRVQKGTIASHCPTTSLFVGAGSDATTATTGIDVDFIYVQQAR